MRFVCFLLVWIHFQSLIKCHKLLDYWNDMSKQSVIKCQDEKYFEWNHSIKDFIGENIYKNQIVNSYKCQNGENPIDFTFKGKVIDFKLEGPGKLRVIQNQV